MQLQHSEVKKMEKAKEIQGKYVFISPNFRGKNVKELPGEHLMDVRTSPTAQPAKD